MRNADLPEFSQLLDQVCTLLSRSDYLPSPEKTAMWWLALKDYPMDEVRAAFSAHIADPQRGRFVPVPADIVAQIQARACADGRPGPEVAWSIALEARDEAASVVWTPEIAAAWDVARPIMALGDEVGARMAFKEAYTAALQAARATYHPARWLLSEGFDKARRAQALRLAIELGRRPEGVDPAGLALACEAAPLLLAGSGSAPGGLSPAGRAAIARFREVLGARKAESTATAPPPGDELKERRRAARERAAAYAESHGIKLPNNGERS